MTRTLTIAALGLALASHVGQAKAQEADRRATTSDNGVASTTRATDDDRGNYGWLGLAGLAGLAGLLPKKTHAVTTHRTGDGNAR